MSGSHRKPAEGPTELPRISSSIRGLDDLTHGGFPQGRLTLVAGTAGSGKTVFATQFLAQAVAGGEAAVFVTFEEKPQGTRSNMRSFGWDIEGWEKAGKWVFVDGSPDYEQTWDVVGHYDLAPLIARVLHAAKESKATRVAIDSAGSLLAQFDDPRPARKALFQLSMALERLGVTTVMTGEREEEYGAVSVHGFEEFVADNVVILRNPLEGERRRRTIEVLKLRGGGHVRGEHLFTLRPPEGIVVVPNVGIDFDYEASTERITSGNRDLDEMLHGGIFKRSVVLVSGPTGSGKSLLSIGFIAGGVSAGERCLLLSFEESQHQIKRNALQLGLDLDAMESGGQLRIVAEAPESAGLEDHLLAMKSHIDEFKPQRVVLDSLTALHRISTIKTFRDYVLGLTFQIRASSLAALLTSTSDASSHAMADLHISTVTDTIVLLQYVASGGVNRRGITVLKMRGSDHDKSLREFVVDHGGLHIQGPFTKLRGPLTPLTPLTTET